MRFRTLKLRGMGATFREEAVLNIEALPGPMVAICGEIGAGKSVALECLMGAIDRTTPTRGRLGDLATSRDSMVEVSVHNGSHYTIRHTMDSISDKGESLVMDEHGNPLVQSGKRRDFDKWSADHFLPAKVRMASTFGAQRSEGFIELKGAARKDVILAVKGCDHFQLLSTAAGELAREVADELNTVAARTDQIAGSSDCRRFIGVATPVQIIQAQSSPRKRVALDIEILKSEITTLEADVATITEDRDRYTKQIEEARVLHATHAGELERHTETVRKRRALDDAIRDKREILTGIKERITNNEGVIGDAAAIRAAADRKPTAEGERAAYSEATAKASAELTAARDRRRNLHIERDGHAGKIERDTKALENGAIRLVGWRANKATAEKQLPLEVEAETKATANAKEHHTEEARLAKLFLNSKDNRIEALREALHVIAADTNDLRHEYAGDLARDAILADDGSAKEAEEAPHKQGAAGIAHRAALDLQSKHGREVHQLRNLITEADTNIRNTDGAAKDWREDRDAARIRLAEVEGGMEVANAEIKDRAAAVEENTTATRRLTEELATIDPLAKHAGALERAEVRLEELRPQVGPLEEQIAKSRRELNELGPPTPAPATPPNIEQLEIMIRRCENTNRADRATIAGSRAKLERREHDDVEAAKLEGRRAELEVELSDWRLLQSDLGRDGLQALEVDAAGPELTELANELLHTCLGTRYSVRLDTTHRSSDGKRDIEDCLVNVIDTVDGHDGEIKEYSGGQRGLIGEAIDLALTMVSARTAGLEGITLVRDERGASQSAESERAYLGMLRHAAEKIGASHVLFVSHRAETRALADSRVTIEGGQFHVS